jgi:uncharacterized protein YjiS (DUF1127 family)
MIGNLSHRYPVSASEPSSHAIVALRALATWYERYRQRRALAALSDGMLKDIGLSRAEAYREIDKPFWQP